MQLGLLGKGLFVRIGAAAAHQRDGTRLGWDRMDQGMWLFGLAIGLTVGMVWIVLRAVAADRDQSEHLVREHHAHSLTCLAFNVYYEARGEPAAGQYAVAEVTMNRTASRRYPDTVCEVVYQRTWDPLRRRHVAAFSWTELGEVEEPSGEEWQRAWSVAEAVYYQRHTPALKGALYFHATYVYPEWAKGKQRVARIGRHVFYR